LWRLDTAEHFLIKINSAMRPASPVSYTSSCNHHIRAFSDLLPAAPHAAIFCFEPSHHRRTASNISHLPSCLVRSAALQVGADVCRRTITLIACNPKRGGGPPMSVLVQMDAGPQPSIGAAPLHRPAALTPQLEFLGKWRASIAPKLQQLLTVLAGREAAQSMACVQVSPACAPSSAAAARCDFDHLVISLL
jgi:hypothetical protein